VHLAGWRLDQGVLSTDPIGPDLPEALDFSGMDDLPTSAIHVQIEGDEPVDTMSPTTHRAGYDILNNFSGSLPSVWRL